MGATQQDLTDRLNLARDIAREAGDSTLGDFQQEHLQWERKADDSPVTAADRRAERLLRKRIAARFPEDAILGEEMGRDSGTTGYEWVLDPIDGTKTFISGVPLFTTLVAVQWDQQSVIGVVYAPAVNEMVYAASEMGAWYVQAGKKPRRAAVSSVRQLSDAVFITSEVSTFASSSNQNGIQTFLKLQDRSGLTRTWGDGYGYLLVATGRAEVMVDPVMNLWDAAAVGPIVEEAGGTFTDWQGKRTVDGGEGIGTNGLVLDEVLAIVRR